jgi:hypothetical protein
MHGSFTESRRSDVAAGVVLDSEAGQVVAVPDEGLLFYGEFKRSGDSLTIVGDGKSFFIPDYFKTDRPPVLMAPNGATLSGDAVLTLAPRAPGQYAQAGGAPATAAQPQIGAVDKVAGNVTVVRNGVAVVLNNGDQIRKGDVIQTGANSQVSIVMVDGTALNLGASTRMAMNEFSFDANSTNNSSLLSLIQGSFAFVAGQVAPTGGLNIETPVATMGIRGTQGGAACADASCSSVQTVATEGSYVLINRATGQVLGTVTVGSAIQVSAAGPNQGPVVTFVPAANVDPQLTAMINTLAQNYPQMFVPVPQAPQTTPQGGNSNGSSTPQDILRLNDNPQNSNPLGNIPQPDQRIISITNPDSAQPPTIIEILPTTPATPTDNATPVLINPFGNQTVPEDQPWSFEVPADAFSDPDNAELTYAASLADGSPLPNWLSFDPVTRTFSGTPPQDANGVVPILIVASDGTSSTSYVFLLTVPAVNDAPVLTLPGATEAASEDTPLDLAGGIVTDPDTGDVVTLKLKVLHGTFDVSGTPPPGITIVDGDGSDGTLEAYGSVEAINALLASGVTYIPDADFAGVDTLTVTVTDAAGATSERQVAIAVSSVNDAPQTLSPPVPFSGNEDQSVAVTLGGFDTDGAVASFRIVSLPANGTLYLDANLTIPVGLNGTVPATAIVGPNGTTEYTATVYFKPDENWNGDTSLQYAAVDDEGLQDTTPGTAQISVAPVNDAPDAIDISLGAPPPGAFQWSGNGHYYMFVPAGEGGISWADAYAAALEMGGYLATITSPQENWFLAEMPATGAFWIGGSDAGQEGTWRWMSGPEAGEAFAYFNWTAGQPDNVNGDEHFLLFYGYGFDMPGPPGSGIPGRTPGYWDDEAGTGPNVFGVENDGFIVEWGGFNESDFVFNEGEATDIPVSVLLAHVNDPDAGDSHTISVHDAVNGTVTLENGIITFTPDAGYHGPASFKYTVTDSGGLTDTATVNFVVQSVNDAPVLNVGGVFAFDGFDDSQSYDGWTEIGDNFGGAQNGSPAQGEFQIAHDPQTEQGDFQLRLSDNDSESAVPDTIQRTFDLGGLTSARLTFEYRRDIAAGDVGDRFFVEISSDGVNFIQIGQIGATGSGSFVDGGYQTFTYDLPPEYISANTTLRFSVGDDVDNGDVVYVDNVQIVGIPAQGSQNSTATFTENGPPVPVALLTGISDADDTNMESATIVLTNRHAGDFFFINGAQVSHGSNGSIGAIDYTVIEDGGTITITFTGTAPASAYQTALESVTFASSSDGPSTEPRIVEITVSDGTSSSNTATTTVDVVGANDAPETTAVEVNGDEDTAVAITLGGTDVDSTVASFLVNLPSDGTLYRDAALTDAIEQGDQEIAAAGNAATIYFKPNQDWNGLTTVLYNAKDNNGAIDPTAAEVTINVTPVNDAPVAHDVSFVNGGSVAGYSYFGSGDGANGHWYKVDTNLSSWTAAATAAAAAGGYLATATSTYENTFIADLVGQNQAWIGASDSAVEGVWRWTGGPEAGLQFWSGGPAPSGNPLMYANWRTFPAEPNNSSNDDHAYINGSGFVSEFQDAGTWNDAPDTAGSLASVIEFSFTEDAVSTIPAAFLLDNITDVDSNSFAINSVQATVDTHGTVTLVGGNVVYTPHGNYNGLASFTYTVKDDQNAVSNSATFTFNVGAVNDAPVVANAIADQALEAGEAFEVPANTFTDIDGNTLTYTATQADDNPLPSWLIFDAQTRTFSTPANFVGVVDVKVTASDGIALASDVFTFNAFVLDQFDNAQAYDGWIETGDDDDGQLSPPDSNLPTNGDFQIASDPSLNDPGNFQLRLSDLDAENDEPDVLERAFDLSGTTSALLSFDFRRDIADGDAGDQFNVEISVDGVNFEQIWQTGATGNGSFVDEEYQTIDFDLTDYISANTTIRFSVGDNVDNGDIVYVDNFKITPHFFV